MAYDVTVVTVVYELVKAGRNDFFRQCVDSVAKQEGVRIEHIIIDGGSADGTRELIAECVGKRDNVTWISEPDNGIYDAMNKGLRMAKGRYITFLNSDDYYHDSTGLGRVVEALDSSKADFSYAPAVILKRDGTRLTTSPHVRPDLRNLLKGMPFSHQSVIVRTDLMKKMGGFSADYPRSADYAFVMELVFAGKKAICVGRDFVTFRAGGFSSLNPSENQREHLVAFASLAKRYLGRELTAKELKAYVYACILRTFGAAALRDGWNGAENDIAPLVAHEFKKVARLEREVCALKQSMAYCTGMFVTWPVRKAWGGVKCLRENGLKYTVKHAVGKVLRCFGSTCKW
ncbi:MAG: glycosyltransferase [Kiritimatiellae bacterium]|nr:glycosyltransferase [Kiritimatiellia bacterium]